jgi:hypothetical protein
MRLRLVPGPGKLPVPGKLGGNLRSRAKLGPRYFFLNWYLYCLNWSSSKINFFSVPPLNMAIMPRIQLFDIMKCSDGNINEKFIYLENQLATMNRCPEEKITSLRLSLTAFKTIFKKKWIEASYKSDRFLEKNKVWLDGSEKVPTWVPDAEAKPGRPTKEFHDLSDRSKRRKTQELREQVS